MVAATTIPERGYIQAIDEQLHHVCLIDERQQMEVSVADQSAARCRSGRRKSRRHWVIVDPELRHAAAGVLGGMQRDAELSHLALTLRALGSLADLLDRGKQQRDQHGD